MHNGQQKPNLRQLVIVIVCVDRELSVMVIDRLLCVVPLHATVYLSICLLPGKVFSQTAGECHCFFRTKYFDFHQLCHLSFSALTLFSQCFSIWLTFVMHLWSGFS